MAVEYNASSMAMKSVLPLLTVLKVVGAGVRMSDKQVTTFEMTIWEDIVGHSPCPLWNLDS